MSRIIICLILFWSCDNYKTTSAVIQSGYIDSLTTIRLKLENSQGNLFLVLPRRYDTAFSWFHHHDGGAVYKYRYQSKFLPITMENGWFWTEASADSIDRLTIIQRRNYDSVSQYGLEDMLETARIQAEIQGNEGRFYNFVEMRQVLDTTIIIANRPFVIAGFNGYNPESKLSAKKVIGITPHKDDYIQFHFLYSTKQKGNTLDSFIQESIDVLKQVRIENGG